MSGLRDLRRARRLTQAELAARVGITQSALAKYESGARLPHYTTAVHLADALGVTLNDLEFEALRQQGHIPPASARHDLQRAIQEEWLLLPIRKLLFTPDRLPRLAVSVEHVAHTFGLHGSTIRREIDRGHLRAKKIGRRVVVLTTGVLEWLEARGAHYGVPQETVVVCSLARAMLEASWGTEDGRADDGPQASS